MRVSLTLTSLEETTLLGALLAQEITRLKITALLCTGPLGSGKTTLIRAIVSALPGSEMAEVSSPSFAIANHYPVEPKVLHADLYRCQNDIPDEILESLENDSQVTMIEWAEFLPKHPLGPTALDLNLTPIAGGRRLTFSAGLGCASSALKEIVTELGKRIPALLGTDSA